MTLGSQAVAPVVATAASSTAVLKADFTECASSGLTATRDWTQAARASFRAAAVAVAVAMMCNRPTNCGAMVAWRLLLGDRGAV